MGLKEEVKGRGWEKESNIKCQVINQSCDWVSIV